jgi:hypothetical protein
MRIDRYPLVRQLFLVAVVVDPLDQALDVIRENLDVPAFAEPSPPQLLRTSQLVTAGGAELGRKEKPVRVDTFECRDSGRHRFDRGPGIASLLTLGDLVPVLVPGALPLLAGDEPQPGDRVVAGAAAFEVEHFAGAHPGQVADHDCGGGAEQASELGGLVVADPAAPRPFVGAAR